MKEFEKLNNNFISDDLSEQEQEIWEKVAPQLIELGIVNTVNYLILKRYCALYVQTQNIIKTKTTRTTTIKTLSKEVLNLEKELCLTPDTYNKFLKDRLIIEERKKKLGNKNEKTTDEYRESFFKK